MRQRTWLLLLVAAAALSPLSHGAVAPGNLRDRRLANDDDETEEDREELDHRARRGEY